VHPWVSMTTTGGRGVGGFRLKGKTRGQKIMFKRETKPSNSFSVYKIIA